MKANLKYGGIIIEIILYILITFGSALMLIPFAWMVDTSFKLPGEVESWPPKWTSENFKRERVLRVFVYEGGSIEHFEGLSLSEFMNIAFLRMKEKKALNLKIFDDPPKRGILRIRIGDDHANYTCNIPDDDFKSLVNHMEKLNPKPQELERILEKVQNIKKLSEEMKEDFIENLLNLMYYNDSALLNRRNFTSDFEKELRKISNFLEKYGSRLLKRTDEKGRKILTDFMENLKKEIFLIIQSLGDYRKGISKNLHDGEIKEISKHIHGVIEYGLEEMKNKSLSKVSALIRKRIIQPLEKWDNLLNFHKILQEFLFKVQSIKLKDNMVIARIREKNSKDVKAEFKQKIMNTRLDRKSKMILMKFTDEKFGNLVNSFINWLDTETVKLITAELDIDYKKAVRIFELLNDILSSFEELTIGETHLKNKMEECLKEGNLLSAFETIKVLNSASVRVLKGKIEKLKSLIEDTGILSSVISTRWEYLEYLEEVVRIYSDVTTKLQIIDAPKIVNNVRLKSGSIISIEFKDEVNPIWFEDENYFVKVHFSFTDLLKNIFQNYVDAWNAAPFARYYLNTVFVALTTTIVEIIFAAMAAFAFAKLNFFGKNVIFVAFLSTMMIPMEVLLVPNYITLAKFGWLDTYYALIVPWTVSVFAIFLIRQHFMSIPNELYDAAKIDGSSDWHFLWSVMVPLSKPVIITAALLKFVGSWNSFLWVLIVTKSPEVRTLPVGLQNFSSEVGTLYNQLMAASTFSILPVIILFLFAQRYFIQGIARTGLK